jgi:hypothetical protein
MSLKTSANPRKSIKFLFLNPAILKITNYRLVMERRLSRFIPLVRLYHISSEDFLLKKYILLKNT